MSLKIASKPILIAVAATALLSGVSAYVWREEHRPAVLEVHIFSLKSGRSMFIRTPEDYRVLIDGGANVEVIRDLSEILPFYSQRIDSVIATNTDGKNVSGLIDVVDRYQVDVAYIPKFTLENSGVASSSDRIYSSFLEKLTQKVVEIKEIEAGDTIKLDRDVSLQVIFPVPPDVFDYSKASAPELLFNIEYKDSSILFMGDASKKVQKYIATSSASTITNSNILVVSHSAAPDNVAAELIRIVHPTDLVYEKSLTVSKKSISKGSSKKKSTKKPVDSLGAVLDEHRFNVKEGSVKVVSDGVSIKIERPK